METKSSGDGPPAANDSDSGHFLAATDHIAFIVYMTGMILDSIANIDRSNGGLSINEMRILNRICMRDIVKDRPITVSELANDLEIPLSTVSKITTRNILDGVLTDSYDPKDRRKRHLRFTPEATATTREWADIVNAGRVTALEKGFPLHKMYSAR